MHKLENSDFTTTQSDTQRLAIIDPDEKKLALARSIVERGKSWKGKSQIFYSPQPVTFLWKRVYGTDLGGNKVTLKGALQARLQAGVFVLPPPP